MEIDITQSSVRSGGSQVAEGANMRPTATPATTTAYDPTEPLPTREHLQNTIKQVQVYLSTCGAPEVVIDAHTHVADATDISVGLKGSSPGWVLA